MMPRISRRLLLVGLLVVALLCGLGVFVSLRSAATEKDQIRTRIRSLATSTAATTERYVTGKLDILQTIAGLQPFRQGDVAGHVDDARSDRRGKPRLQPGDGLDRPYGSRRRAPSRPTVDLGDRSYFREVLATGRPYVSEAIVGRIRSAAVIVFAVPTLDAAGDVNGVLTGGTRLADLDLLAPSLEFAGTDVRLVDRDGNLLTGQAGIDRADAGQPGQSVPGRCARRGPASSRESLGSRASPTGSSGTRRLRLRTGSSHSPSRGPERSPVRPMPVATS